METDRVRLKGGCLLSADLLARSCAGETGHGHTVAAAVSASVASLSDSSRPTCGGSSTWAQPGPAA